MSDEDGGTIKEGTDDGLREVERGRMHDLADGGLPGSFAAARSPFDLGADELDGDDDSSSLVGDEGAPAPKKRGPRPQGRTPLLIRLTDEEREIARGLSNGMVAKGIQVALRVARSLGAESMRALDEVARAQLAAAAGPAPRDVPSAKAQRARKPKAPEMAQSTEPETPESVEQRSGDMPRDRY